MQRFVLLCGFAPAPLEARHEEGADCDQQSKMRRGTNRLARARAIWAISGKP